MQTKAKAKITADLSVINYREMLVKYMLDVAKEEGIDYALSFDGSFFNKAEVDEMTSNILPEVKKRFEES